MPAPFATAPSTSAVLDRPACSAGALADAVRVGGLRDAFGRPLHPTPHQPRRSYGPALINGGMSLQALMALLGYVTPEMTLRYAHLASDTFHRAYDAAMAETRPSKFTVTALVPSRCERLLPPPQAPGHGDRPAGP